ncbi:anthrax toxin receptor-like isoform X2 [Talpa occidentalis]|uniref:anthrax toxin receptor-like isoform X2 n=1 Tax=Talpa occidentalis TaxID=50954 RepID=UPI0023F8F126|nr:anthrax toxin receptor-like isoform X2 [Talpa occidentalis]
MCFPGVLRSGSVDTNWIFIYDFVEDFLKMFQNPNMQVSIVTFSTRGHTILKLTSDKKEIEDGLNKLRNTVPTGNTDMQEGFKAVNEQISTANSGEKKVHSMVVSLIDGALWPESFQATKNEAQRTRQLGGTVYVVGVNNFVKNQLLPIADSEEHVVGVHSGFYDLKHIIDSLVAKSCIELTSVDPPIHCVGENYNVGIFGRGFHNTKNKNEVLCRFQISDTIFFDEKATQVEDTSIKCPGVMIEIPANEISVEVSLNNGASFISNGLKISSKDCGSHRTGQRMRMSHSGVPRTHSSSVIRPMRKVLRRNSGQIPGVQVNAPAIPNMLAALTGNQSSNRSKINTYHLAASLLILLIPLMIGCLWRLHSRKNKTVQPCAPPTCPTVVVPGYDNLTQLEDKLDTLRMQIMGNFFQNRNRGPAMCCQPRHKPCSLFRALGRRMCGYPRCCLQPSPACFPSNCCWTRCPYTPCQPPQPICSQPHNWSAPGSPPGCVQ